MKILFATHNVHKVKEAKSILSDLAVELVSLSDLGIDDEIIEDGATLDDNAWIKADYLHDRYQTNVIADDTGLEVHALDGAPGVYSARYAGPQKDREANMDKLLGHLEGSSNREAQFRTILAGYIDGQKISFEGIVQGVIAHERAGTGGFGYDPIFIPAGYQQSFGQLSPDIKNKMSHRSLAFSHFKTWLASMGFKQ